MDFFLKKIYSYIVDMLPINKIYVDSRHKTSSSKSDSEFEIQLKEAINLPDNCVCVISDVILKNAITIVESFNENLYVRLNNIDKTIKLNNRNFSVIDLGAHVAAKINEAFRTESNPTPVEFLDDTFNTKIV